MPGEPDDRGMTTIADRTVLFADLRGSTALFESLGNAEATSVVTSSSSSICAAAMKSIPILRTANAIPSWISSE